MSARGIVVSLLLCGVLLFGGHSAQAAGRCVDQSRNQVFDLLDNGVVVQVGNPANRGLLTRDPSGQMFLRLPSTTPLVNAFFVSWQGEFVEISSYNGARVIGGCQFQLGDIPPRQYPNYQQPVMHPSLYVQTPQGSMPIPRAIADAERPFAQPMITGEAQAQRCYQQAWTQAGGLNREQFGDCMVTAMTGGRTAAAYQCMRSNGSPEAQAFCMVGVLGGQREKAIAGALQQCHTTYGADYSRYPLCMSSGVVDGDAGRLLDCVEQQGRQGQITMMGTALCYGAQNLDLNPEMQIVVQCAAATGGQPYAFTSCAGGQLTARELDKCINHGVGGPQGCFGPNNDIVRGFQQVGNVLAGQFGPNNTIVSTWNTAVHDITQSPGPNNDALRVMQNVGNEVQRAPGNVVKAVESVMPKIKW